MALIPKVGGPTNTNSLQLQNTKANNGGEEQQADLASALAPATPAPKSEYLSSLDTVVPQERQSELPLLTPGGINEGLTDQMGRPAVRQNQGAATPPQGEVGIGEAMQGTFSEDKFQKLVNNIGGAEAYGKLTTQQQNALRAKATTQGTLVGEISAGQMALNDTTLSSTSPQVLGAVEQKIKSVNPDAPFEPSLTEAGNTYMGNLLSNALKQSYRLKKQASADAASRGLGRENLNEAYNQIDADVNTAFQLAQNEFINADIQRKFESTEAEKNRTFTAQEAAKDREFQKLTQAKGFEYQMALTQYTTEQQVGIEKMKVAATSMENQAQRLWQSNENLQSYDFQKQMQLSDQDFSKWAAQFDRGTQAQITALKAQYDAVEADKDRIWGTGEREAGQAYATGERVATQTWTEVQQMKAAEAAKFLRQSDIGFETWKTQFDSATQLQLENLRNSANTILQKDAQTFEASQKLSDADLQKWLSGQELDMREMELTYGRETALIMENAQEEWAVKQLQLTQGFTAEEAQKTRDYDKAINSSNQQWDDYMSTKTFDQQKDLENLRIQASYTQQSIDQAFTAAQNLSAQQFDILMSKDAASLQREIKGMDIASQEKLLWTQQEFQKLESGLDRQSQEYLAQLDSQDKYAILERELSWKSIMFGKETAAASEAAAIKAAADKEYLQTEMNYKWASMAQDNAIQTAQVTGQFTPVTGYQKNADGTLAKSASGQPIPIYGQTVMTLDAAKQIANINIEMTQQLGYMVQMVNGMPQAVLDSQGNKIATMDTKKWNDQLIQQGVQNQQWQSTFDQQKARDQAAIDEQMWGRTWEAMFKKGVSGAVSGLGTALGTAIGGGVTSGISSVLGSNTDDTKAGTFDITNPTAGPAY